MGEPDATATMRVDWWRAAVAGAIGGGVLWGLVVVLLVAAHEHEALAAWTPWILALAGVVVLTSGAGCYVRAPGVRERTYGAAILLALGTGLFVLAFAFVFGGVGGWITS